PSHHCYSGGAEKLPSSHSQSLGSNVGTFVGGNIISRKRRAVHGVPQSAGYCTAPLIFGQEALVFDFPFRREFAMFEAPSLKEISGCPSPVTLVWASSTK